MLGANICSVLPHVTLPSLRYTFIVKFLGYIVSNRKLAQTTDFEAQYLLKLEVMQGLEWGNIVMTTVFIWLSLVYILIIELGISFMPLSSVCLQWKTWSRGYNLHLFNWTNDDILRFVLIMNHLSVTPWVIWRINTGNLTPLLPSIFWLYSYFWVNSDSQWSTNINWKNNFEWVNFKKKNWCHHLVSDLILTRSEMKSSCWT